VQPTCVLGCCACREPSQQQHFGGEDQQNGLEPDIAHEDWGTAALPRQPPARAEAAAQM
jgi:hypothetical protein